MTKLLKQKSTMIVTVIIKWLVLMMMIMSVKSQRRVVGDIREQSISQLADFDAREERVFRRPATYLILASKVVRPSSIYQVC